MWFLPSWVQAETKGGDTGIPQQEYRCGRGRVGRVETGSESNRHTCVAAVGAVPFRYSDGQAERSLFGRDA